MARVQKGSGSGSVSRRKNYPEIEALRPPGWFKQSSEPKQNSMERSYFAAGWTNECMDLGEVILVNDETIE